MPGDTSVKIVLEKDAAEGYIPGRDGTKEINYTFEASGSSVMQAAIGRNTIQKNQDYAFFTPGEIQPVAGMLMFSTEPFDTDDGDPGKGALKILKYNKVTGQLVAGAKFEIRGVSESNWDFLVQIQASAGAEIPLPGGGKATTKAGVIELLDIRPGQYQITEISPPPYFDYCDLGVNSKVVTVIEGPDAGNADLFPQVVFENNPFATLRIKKIDAVTGDPVNGAVLRVRNPLANYDLEFKTMNGGVIEIKNLPQGNYEISEVFAPEGYVLSSEVKTETLRWGETTAITFENIPKTELQVKKIDSITSEPLSGALFRLTNPKTGDTWEDETYYDGYAIFSDILAGVYILEELKAPAGYVLDVTQRTIVIENYKTNEIYIQNSTKPGLIIKKYDEKTGKPLENAEFSISVKGGALVYEGMTDKDGKIQLDNLESNWYTITELAAPHGYLIATKTKDVLLEPNTVLEVKFDNRPCPELQIIKTDDKGNPLPKALFQIKKADGETIFEKWTDDNGEILITYDDAEIMLEEGVYSVDLSENQKL